MSLSGYTSWMLFPYSSLPLHRREAVTAVLLMAHTGILGHIYRCGRECLGEVHDMSFADPSLKFISEDIDTTEDDLSTSFSYHQTGEYCSLLVIPNEEGMRY